MWLGCDSQQAQTVLLRPVVVPLLVAEAAGKRKPRVWRKPAVKPVRYGDANAALNGAWGLYCRVCGLHPEQDRPRLRRGAARVARREVGSTKQLTRDEKWQVAEWLNDLTEQKDGGYNAHLRGHCDDLGRVSRLYEAASGLLLGLGESITPGAYETPPYELLCDLLQEHEAHCPGQERCTLLADAEALLTGADARRAA